MNTADWQSFREELGIAVRHILGVTPYFAGVGVGDSEEWGQEDAFTLVAPQPLFSDTRKQLYDELARLGRFYGQEAVAVTEGPTQFV